MKTKDSGDWTQCNSPDTVPSSGNVFVSPCWSQDSSVLVTPSRMQTGSPVPMWQGRARAGGKAPEVVSYLLCPRRREASCQVTDITSVIHHEVMVAG